MRTPIFSKYHSAAGIHYTPQTGKAVRRWLFGLGGHILQRHCARHCRLLLRLLSSLDQTLLATWSEHRLRQGSGWNGELRSLGVSVATEWWAKTKAKAGEAFLVLWHCWNSRTVSSMSLSIPGHQTWLRAIAFMRAIPGWASWSTLRIGGLKVGRMIVCIPYMRQPSSTESSFLSVKYGLS